MKAKIEELIRELERDCKQYERTADTTYSPEIRACFLARVEVVRDLIIDLQDILDAEALK